MEPKYQNKGIGSWLLLNGILRVRALDKNAVIYASTSSRRTSEFFVHRGFGLLEANSREGTDKDNHTKLPPLYSLIHTPAKNATL